MTRIGSLDLYNYTDLKTTPKKNLIHQANLIKQANPQTSAYKQYKQMLDPPILKILRSQSMRDQPIENTMFGGADPMKAKLDTPLSI